MQGEFNPVSVSLHVLHIINCHFEDEITESHRFKDTREQETLQTNRPDKLTYRSAPLFTHFWCFCDSWSENELCKRFPLSYGAGGNLKPDSTSVSGDPAAPFNAALK